MALPARIIANQRQRAADWARPLFGVNCFTPSDQFTALLLEKDLEVQAVALYNQYVPRNSIDIHCAAMPGKRWLTRPFLSAAFRYPFLDLGVRRVGTLVAANNADSLRFVRHLGFVQEGIAREAWFEGVDLICFGMLRRECRYLSGPAPEIWRIDDGKTFSTGSARPRSDGERADCQQ